LLVAVAEMALASGIGVELERMDTPFAFNETQSRYLVSYPADAPLNRAEVPFERIGTTGGDSLRVNGAPIPLTDLRDLNERFFREWMEA
jgi:phosphoribosylformylglycinamidine synthase